MIHCRDHLINWLVKESKSDVLLHNTLMSSGSRVELFGTFNPLPGSKHPGWLVEVASYRGRKDLIAIVKDYLGRPVRWYIAGRIDWDNWQGPSEDVLIGGDANGPMGGSMKTTVVHCRRDEYDVLIDRTTKRGNPYIIGPDGNRDEVCDKHMKWLEEWTKNKKEIIMRGLSNKWQVEHLEELRGQRIACWCATERCHGDNYVRLLNGPEGKGKARFHRIERHATVHSQEDKGESKPKTVPPVVKKRSYPPPVPKPI